MDRSTVNTWATCCELLYEHNERLGYYWPLLFEALHKYLIPLWTGHCALIAMSLHQTITVTVQDSSRMDSLLIDSNCCHHYAWSMVSNSYISAQWKFEAIFAQKFKRWWSQIPSKSSDTAEIVRDGGHHAVQGHSMIQGHRLSHQ